MDRTLAPRPAEGRQSGRSAAISPELERLGDEVKALGLDATTSVDETLRRVARLEETVDTSASEPASVSLRALVEGLDRRLSAIQTDLSALVQQRVVKEYYSTEEVAKIVGRDPYTVREWCRYGRLRAEKRRCGRGKSPEWAIPHAELVRYQNEGLLPLGQQLVDGSPT